jgi:hypothetical protein
MICPIQVRRAVDEDKRVFWDLNHNVRACLSIMGKGCHRRMKTSVFPDTGKDFAIVRIARKNQTVDKFVIFSLHMNNSRKNYI